jgi:hypothetical protein
MAVAVTDSLHFHLDTARGKTTLHALLSYLTAAGVNVTTHQVEAALTIDGPDGLGAIAMGSADSTFTDTRKVVLSLTSPLPLFYAITLKKKNIYMMSHPIDPRFLRIYRVPKPAIEEGEILPSKPVPHTQAALDHIDMATDLFTDYTLATNGLPSEKNHNLCATTTSRNDTRSSSPLSR